MPDGVLKIWKSEIIAKPSGALGHPNEMFRFPSPDRLKFLKSQKQKGKKLPDLTTDKKKKEKEKKNFHKRVFK